MFTLHHTNAVSTQKHLSSNGTSMGRRVVSRTLKTVQKLVLWVESNKDDVNKSTLFQKRIFKLETLHFYGRVRRRNVLRGISTRRGNVETRLCDRKKPCGSYQTHDDSEVRTSSRSLRSSSQEADFEGTWSNRIDNIFHWTDSSTVLQWLQSAHKKQQVFVANRATEILENSSMDQWRHVKGIENPADIGTRGMSIEGLKESGWLNGPAWLQTDEKSDQGHGTNRTKFKLSKLLVV